MGIGGIGIWQLLIILVIVLLLFGTKKLRSLGGDLGSAIKSFKKAVNGEKSEAIAQDSKASKTSGKPPQKSSATATDNTVVKQNKAKKRAAKN